MATIALVLDHQEGHLIPTFPLARRLRERGHRIVYLTAADGGSFVRQNGFDFVPILEDVYPRGMFQTLREGSGMAAAGQPGEPFQYVISLAEGPELEATIEGGDGIDGIRPDLFLVNTLYPLFAWILHLRFARPVVLLTPYLRERPKADLARRMLQMMAQPCRAAEAFHRLVGRARPEAAGPAALVDEFLAFPELILCPEAFEIPQPDRVPEPNVHYVEEPVDPAREGELAGSFPWERIDGGKKLLLCSMGSQSYLMGAAALTAFYRTVAAAARAEPGWQLVLATGGQIDETALPELPADALLARWVPQPALLRRATAMITHGGLGALREAIACGVPLLVFPFANDQPANARRVVHHGLGLAGAPGSVDADQLRQMLHRIDGEPEFRRRVGAMRERFAEAARAGTALPVIEGALRTAAGER